MAREPHRRSNPTTRTRHERDDRLADAAIGLALSPVPIIELILVIFSRRRVANTVAFVLALIVLTVAAVAIGAAGQSATESSAGKTSAGMAIALVVLGVLLLIVGARNWRNRGDTSEPKALQTIASMGPPRRPSSPSGPPSRTPRTSSCCSPAGQTIGAATFGSKILLGGGFVLLATALYTLAAGYALIGGPPANRKLDRARAWLVTRNRLIMGVICLLLGLLLFVKGVAAL